MFFVGLMEYILSAELRRFIWNLAALLKVQEMGDESFSANPHAQKIHIFCALWWILVRFPLSLFFSVTWGVCCPEWRHVRSGGRQRQGCPG